MTREMPQASFRIGVDVVEVDRMRRALHRRPRLVAKLFTPAEREYCEARPEPATHFAVRFAAKEAVRKALGHGVAWHDVEVRSLPGGPPRLALADSVATASGAPVRAASLSLSHDAGVAVATVLIEA